MIDRPHLLRWVVWCVAALLVLLAWAGCGNGDGGNRVAVTLTAMPEIVQTDEATTLRWVSQNATRVVSSNFNATDVNGTMQVTPTEATTYTITVANGQKTASARVRVVPLNMPSEPLRGETENDLFYVPTENYFYLYGVAPADAPFSVVYQFADQHYPIGVSYQSVTDPPEGFVLSAESELVMMAWAQADPRVCAISGVAPGAARIKVSLVESISYGGANNIIGLTKAVPNASGPCFEVAIVTRDPYTGGEMSFMEMERTLTHEIGHALGLGHTPDLRDVMYYQSNSAQGVTPRTYLTYGDARAIWSTLTARLVHWHPERPPITQGAAGMLALTRNQRHLTVTDEGGVVICVYPR